MTHAEAPLSVNFKPNKEYDAPLLTVRGIESPELVQRIHGLEAAGVFLAVADADAKFKAAYAASPGAQVAAQVLGAQPVAVEAPVAAPAPVANPYAQPAAPAAPAAPAYQAPAPAAPAQPAAASAGAPFIPAFGQAAVFRSGQSARGPWSAYFDPRPKQVTDAIPVDHTGKQPTTDDVNHPGLAAGTHKFSKFIR